MALLGNISLLHRSPAKYTTGTVGFNDRANWNKPGMMRNRGDLTLSTFWKYDSVPSGMYAGTAFFVPQKAGSIRGRESISLDANGLAVGGITTTGTAQLTMDFSVAQVYPLDDSPPARTASGSFSINFSSATGQLISSGSGSALMQFTLSDALLTASIGGIGSANFIISTNSPLLGAITQGSGSSTILISTNTAIVYPLNDTSPIRTASGSMNFSGSLSPYAIGSMQGNTESTTVLTPDSIASAVWNALAADVNTPNTTGNKLNTASTGGVDMTALVNAILDDARFKKVLTKGSFLALK